MTRDEIAEVIAELQEATGPDNRLDYILHILAGWQDDDEFGFTKDGIRKDGWPAYTASIDAALTLVPEDVEEHDLSFLHYDEPVSYIWTSSGRVEIGRASTPALAVCIAALKAMEGQA